MKIRTKECLEYSDYAGALKSKSRMECFDMFVNDLNNLLKD